MSKKLRHKQTIIVQQQTQMFHMQFNPKKCLKNKQNDPHTKSIMQKLKSIVTDSPQCTKEVKTTISPPSDIFTQIKFIIKLTSQKNFEQDNQSGEETQRQINSNSKQKCNEKTNNSENISKKFINLQRLQTKKSINIYESWTEYVLIGNQNQLDLQKIELKNQRVKSSIIWSLNLQKNPIKGVQKCKFSQSKLILWTQHTIYVYSYDKKNLLQCPKQIKHTEQKKIIYSIQFIKRNIFIVCFKDGAKIYELFDINSAITLDKQLEKCFQVPQNYKVFSIPQIVQNQIKIFYIYKNQREDQPTFRLYFISLEHFFDDIQISQLKKVYDFKKNLQKQIKIINYTKAIFLINLRSQIIAIKNGMIIDNVNVNFKGTNLFLKIISRNKLVHFLQDKIEIYKYNLNLNVMPQKIQLRPVDSISFERDFSSNYLKVVQFKLGYGIFFQKQFQQQSKSCLQKGIINYWFGVTIGVQLSDKLDSIFPQKQNIEDTKLQILQQKCDMAIKMGLNQDQAYLQLWKRCKQQSDKDFQILMNTKKYDSILNEIVGKMKKSSVKFRLIKKIQSLCCQMLRQRIYSELCCFESIKQYSTSHFLLLKLQVFKDIEVQTKRFRKQQYNKNVKPQQQNLKGILSFIQMKKQLSPKNSVCSKKSFKKNSSQSLFRGIQKIVEEKKQQQKKQQQKAKQQQNPFASNIFLGAFFPVKQQLKQQINGNKTSDFRKIETLTEIENVSEQNDEVKISIKDYYLYRDCHIKQHFLYIVFDFMGNQYLSSDCLKIFSLRAFLRIFRLQFRLCYQQILIQVLKIYKTSTKKLIEYLPEFLPFKSKQTDHQESLYYGIWNSIQKRQIQSNLFLDDFITIQNKQIVSDFIKNIWYKRNHNTHHSVITLSKNQITQKFSQQRLNQLHEHFFYLFYSKILELKQIVQKQTNKAHKKEQGSNKESVVKLCQFFASTIQIDKYDQLIKYVQMNYPLSPEHLKGKIFLYENLFYYLKQFNEKANSISLYDFLHLQDFELFQIFFKVQKQKKGFLIKCILPIYERISQKGKQDFIIGINSFFRSAKSEVTDLKTILNRLNNQKCEFHYRFQRLYQVLIQAIMNKIKVGTGNDIPIQQLLIYIQNIPFSLSKTNIIKNLSFIQEVNFEIDLLSKAKLNMSIKQIQQNPQEVITALVKSQLRRFEVIDSKEQGDLKLCFYKIISQIQSVKGHLYEDQLQNFSSFVFVTQIISNQSLISMIKNILNDEFVIQNFQIDYNFFKSVMFYSFKSHMAKNHKNYLKSKNYIKQILTFLPSDDKDRKFIELQIRYCQIFQRCNYYLPYPLSLSRKIPNINQIQYHIRKIKASELQKLDINQIFQTFQSLRNLLEPDLQEENIQLKKRQFFKQLFQITFLRFLKQKRFKEAIKIIQQIAILKLQENCVIYPILLIDMIFIQITEKSQRLLAQLVSYLFYQSERLTQIVKHLINYPHTSKQFDDYILKEIKNSKKTKKISIYNKKNSLFRQDFIKILKGQQNKKYQKGFCKLVQHCLTHLVNQDECLEKQKAYNLIYRIICHQPYLAAKFISLRQNGLNYKIFRQFLSFLSTQVIFQPLNVIKFGKHIMEILLNRAKNQCSLDQMIQQYSKYDINLIKQDTIFAKQTLSQNQLILLNSLQIMNTKVKYFQQSNLNFKIQQMHQKTIQSYQENTQKQNLQLSSMKTNNFLSLLQYPNQISKLPSYKYMYHCDQDDVYTNRQKYELQYFQIKEWLDYIKFDDFNQRHEIHVCKKNTIIFQNNSIIRNRKKSAFLPQSFHLQTAPIKTFSSLKVVQQDNFFKILTKSISQKQTPSFLNVPTQKNSLKINNSEKIKQQNSILQSSTGKSHQDDFFGLLRTSMKKYKIGSIITHSQNQQITPQVMKKQIFQIVNQTQPILDLTQINRIKNNSKIDFNKLIRQVCQLIYQSDEKQIKFRVCIIDQILNNFYFPNLRLNILKIFVNGSRLKFVNSIDLPFTYLFPFEALFCKQQKTDIKSQEKDQMTLFKSIKDKIMKVINGLNVKHFSELILYAFGKNSYHDQMYYQYMLTVIQEALIKFKTLNQIANEGSKIIQKLAFLIQDIIDMDYFKDNIQGLKNGNSEDFKKYKLFDMGVQKMKLNEQQQKDLQDND